MRKGRRRDGLCQALPGLKGVVLRMAPYWRPHGGLIGAGSAALIAAVLARLLEPWPLKFVIDHIVPLGRAAESAPAATGLPFLGDLPLTGFLLACALGLVSVIGMRAMFEYLATIAFALAGNRILTAVRGDLFRHLQRLPLAFHSRQRAGDLVVRLIGDVGMMKETVVTAAMPLAVNGLVLLGMAMVMFWLDWRLALLALSPLPLLWLGTLRQGTKIRNVSREQRQTEGRLAAAASESLVGIRTVQALGLEDEISGGFANANSKSLAQGVRAKRLAAALERFVDLLVAIATALVLYFGTLFVIDGKLTPGDLLVFITYLKNTFRPVRDYAKFSARLAKATAAGERVIELLDTPLEIRDQADAEPARIERGRIRFEHVEFTHPGQQTTLRGIDLAIEPGEKIAVTGPSGSGKSTLISLLLRLYDPDAGSIIIDGQDLRKVTLASLRQQIAFVPQETLLVNASMRDNLLLGVGRPVDQAELETAARLANAHEFIERLPKGYDTIQAERGASLSAGQRQRLAIARAALRQSPVLVLDEPTVGLDSNNDALVTEAIWRIARGRTTILVTHDLALAARADRVVYLAEGLITEAGSHAELVRAGGLYADVWRQQRVCADARAA